MPVRAVLKRNLYKDSVALMRVAEALADLSGVGYAGLMMGTPANKEILRDAGRLPADVAAAAPDDLMIVLEADSAGALDAAAERAEALLVGAEQGTPTGEREESPPQSLALAVARVPDATLVQVSVPGAYAAAEALKALRRGLHVFLFSDNVPIEQEVVVKQLAERKGLFVMGPDCGTALLGGVPLGFANVVRPGSIGLVGASGTGLQQVTSLIHRLGEGVSHAIGTGSRDLSETVGGITTRQAVEFLREDASTRVVVLLSKPPSPTVAGRILDQVREFPKPVVVLFLGGDPKPIRAAGATPATTLDEAAGLAVSMVRGGPPPAEDIGHRAGEASELARRLDPGQRFVRGLFSGGTFCSEAQVVWRQMGLRAFSNVPLDKACLLPDPRTSRENTAIDLGSDEFTVGRPHPMIDFRCRAERLLSEARDPSVAVILLDIVLGYGAHPDPASALAPVLAEARTVAERAGRWLAMVGSVCGTEDDPQRLSVQEARLQASGMLLAPSNASAARLAALIATRDGRRMEGER